jgi:hypothetical protein
MHELRGKGWRVIGYFVWMMGAGVVLESGQLTAGRLLLLIGAALFGLGVWQSLRADGGRP